ncbi:MAG: folylpolyglutamate synthase/dihydrofolate synthase family protein, partial [Kiritimatiellia bacterium]|nr:folylpolyglutamate synthase/dihydrofolate synthase family protein [Kiritimatiellia bacterium]
AGTNGKGSVCALLESVLRAAGFKTGLYTSPHLMRVNERIKVNGECISDEDLVVLIELVEKYAEDYRASPDGREVTFFEFLTALAFEYFRRKNVETLILETGLGGRLDATNVVTPQVSVITSISREHTKYLGASLEEIAAEKGGIIKPGVPVVLGNLPEEAFQVIERLAQAKNARIIRAEQAVTVRRQSQTVEGQKISIESSADSYGTVLLPLLGAHQLGNAAIAIAVLEEWCRVNEIDLPQPTVKKGFGAVAWPGRLQVISRKPITIVDGAHNPEASATLNAALKELFEGRPIYLILGMCSDKDAAGFIRNLTVPISHCWVVSLANERSLPPEELARQVKNKGWHFSVATAQQALEEAGRLALQQDGIVCAAGSFYLVGEIFGAKKRKDNFLA